MAQIELQNVTVEFPVYDADRSLRKMLLRRTVGGRLAQDPEHRSRTMVCALSDISFKLEPGDRLGLIGPNGAGKSTLLHVLSGVYAPILGQVEVEGRVSAPFSLWAHIAGGVVDGFR